ncbi:MULTISPECIES: class I SAM-dependent methyltransferase [Halococcus]|uniref:Type 11 methyltransferase n=1 Tax=Halococcus salifodinae DSM 8989 TaxID=1227456 RepID=M0N032_9EURY|nr:MULTISPECIES: class I SAM-dependent methyltransferase [Halococcus]EMA50000.1 type 11 methyltransferase [Halococcus salifodinae DSM 8989]
MSGEAAEASFDWDAYWTDADEEKREEASPSAHHAAEVLPEFVERFDAPPGVADVGCGAGVTTFAVADRLAEPVVGYDTAAPVVERNRDRAAREGVENVRFEQTTLPEFTPDREFGVVFAYFTLQYVRDVEQALENLYAAVAPGGALVCNYMNRAAREFCLVAADDPHDNADHPFVFDPDQYTERFGALLDGDSVLSRERIYETLGTWPRSAFTVADRPDVRWAWHHAPLVYVPKL